MKRVACFLLSLFFLVSAVTGCGVTASNVTPAAGPAVVSDTELAAPIDGLMKAAMAGDVETASSYWASNPKGEVASEAFAPMIKDYPWLYDGYQSVTIKEKMEMPNASGDQEYSVKATINYSDGSHGAMDAIVDKKADGWKIESMNIVPDSSRVKDISPSASSPTVTQGIDPENGWKRYECRGASISLPGSYTPQAIPTDAEGMQMPEGLLLIASSSDGETTTAIFLMQGPGKSTSLSGQNASGSVELIELQAGEAKRTVSSIDAMGTKAFTALYEIVHDGKQYDLSFMVTAQSQSNELGKDSYLPEFDRIAESLVFVE